MSDKTKKDIPNTIILAFAFGNVNECYDNNVLCFTVRYQIYMARTHIIFIS